MSTLLYRVLAASGGYVNGEEVEIGALVPLTTEEARYEVDVGNVEATGVVAPLPTVPAVLATDIIATLRGALTRRVDVAALESYLSREGGVLAKGVEARGDEIAVDLTRRLDAILTSHDVRLLTTSAQPTGTDVAPGRACVHKNSATGRLSLWVNDGGAVVDLLAPATF